MQTVELQERSCPAIRVTAIGISAAPILARGGLLGHVCASFRRSCYVQTQDAEVLCLADGALGRGPLTVSVQPAGGQDAPAFGVAVGTPVFTEGDCLHLGRLTLEMADAAVWHPRPIVNAVDGSAAEGVRWLVSAIGHQAPAEGLGCLLPCVEALASGWTPGSNQPLPPRGLAPPPGFAPSGSVPLGLAPLALTALTKVANGLLGDDAPSTEEGVGDLLGLGPGLTPSGDDVLAGALQALHAAGLPAARVLSRIVARQAPAMTGLIAASMLRQAAQGLGGEAGHHLITALFEGRPANCVLQKAEALISIGHTSGWDALLGIALGIHLAERLATMSPMRRSQP